MNPFQSVVANTSSSPTPPRSLLTPEQRASVDAAYAELVGGIDPDVYGQPRSTWGHRRNRLQIRSLAGLPRCPRARP
jgi:hypothetical protein